MNFRKDRVLEGAEKLKIPENVRWIIHTLQEHNFEAYAVGGCVRDTLLGRVPQDWDITTSAKPEEVKALFRRTIDTGIEHGTVTVMIGKEGYEVTTYRVDGEYADHRHPREVVFTPELKEDLRRRDFTINAMAYNDRTGIVDEFRGREDMKNGKIRAVGNPLERFDEDALRMLRAIRFAGQLGFEIEENTIAAIHEKVDILRYVSAERIQVELVKLLNSKEPEKIFIAQKTGLTKIFLPEFDMMCETGQNNPHHYLDVAHHSMEAVRYVRRIFLKGMEADIFHREKDSSILTLAALLHDVAKPLCKTVDEKGIDHFYGHDKRGAELSVQILRRLKFDNETIKIVSQIIKYHDYRYDGGRKAMRRFMNRVGVDNIPYLFALQEADLSAQSEYMREEKTAKLEQAKELFLSIRQAGEAVTVKELAVTGKDLLEAGVKQGPEIGRCLACLLDMVLENPELNEREHLLELLKEVM
ncbi:MAG: CCA tRNA nucleotidyltransferase [Lachnospiraceae bacterium]|nr:CCA tRNA nucleotidyltransferase [Lachnospiraceae bacterium]